MNVDGTTRMHLGRIGCEQDVNRQAAKDVRMPADGVMRQGARGLGQRHREGDENEPLPKFGNFEPDQKCERAEPAAAKKPRRGRCARSSRWAASLAVR